MTDVIVKRLHKPLVLRDQDDTWYTVCHACTADAGQPVIECRVRAADEPWPPFKLVEQPAEPAAKDAEYYARLAAQHNRHLHASELENNLVGIIETAIRNRPRSQQRRIGPSEIGHECTRWLGYKLADTATLNPIADKPAWRTQVGMATHDWLADTLTAVNAQLEFDRFLVEHRVHACTLTLADGTEVPIEGSGDAYDSWTATVLDWKIVGPTTLKKVKAVSRQTGVQHGASQRYRVQGHNYGKGYARLGLPVWRVMIAFLPAAGDLEDAFFHVEAWDEQAADDSAARLQGVQALVNALPLALALDALPTADAWCNRCPYYRPSAQSLDAGCPGHADRKVRRDSLLGLVPTAESVT